MALGLDPKRWKKTRKLYRKLDRADEITIVISRKNDDEFIAWIDEIDGEPAGASSAVYGSTQKGDDFRWALNRLNADLWLTWRRIKKEREEND